MDGLTNRNIGWNCTELDRMGRDGMGWNAQTC